MADDDRDFLAQARRAAQPIKDVGGRTDAHVSPESLMERTPVVTPQTHKHFPGGMPYGQGSHPTDTPVTPVTDQQLRSARSNPTSADQKLRHEGWLPADPNDTKAIDQAQPAATKAKEQTKTQPTPPPKER